MKTPHKTKLHPSSSHRFKVLLLFGLLQDQHGVRREVAIKIANDCILAPE
jgi:hypothetical protein